MPDVRLTLAAALLSLVLVAGPARADDAGIALAIKDHQFVPATIDVPAGQKVKLVIRNQGAEAAEFESVQLHREKVVLPGSEITVFVGPLDPGSYEFFDDFHPDTRGHLIAK